MKHRQRGFGPTQIETLGVVVLIGIIAALFIPNYINMMVSQRIIEAVEASQPLRDHIGRSIANGEMPLATQDIEQRFTERLVDGKLIEKLAAGEDGTVRCSSGGISRRRTAAHWCLPPPSRRADR